MTTESPDKKTPSTDDLQVDRRRRERADAWRTTARPLSAGAAAVGVITASIGIIAPPAYADDYPSWGDVQQAKHNVSEQQALVTKIDGLIADLQNAADAASLKAELAAESYLTAKTKLDAATGKAKTLKSEAAGAEKAAKTSAMRAGLLASHLAQAGGDSSLNLLLTGDDPEASDSLLYQLGTMSQLTEQSSAIYAQALKDKNAAASLSAQASSAEKVRKQLSDAAADALSKAQDAASAAQQAVEQQQSKQTQLVAQLAALKNTSTEVAQKYADGQAALAKQKQEEAQRAAAARPPAPAASGGSGTAGGSGSSGSSSSSGGSGGSAPAPGGGSAGAPNSSAVEAAISYAYAHIGAPYALDGAGPTYYDCSGLTMMAYAAAGIDIGYHSVTSQYYTAQAQGQLVPFSQRQRGDLIFWYSPGEGFYHVAIYLGGNEIIAARDYGEPLAVEPLWGTPVGYVARPSA